MFGLVDWLAIPSGTRAKRIGLLHGATNVTVVVLFAVAWWMRSTPGDPTPTRNIFLIQIVALALGTIAGWLGGELVDRLAVGVDEGANLDAPSSLGGRPGRSARPRTAPER